MPTATCPTCRIAHGPESECVDVLKGVAAKFVRLVGPAVKHAPSEEFMAVASVPALKAAILGMIMRNGARGQCRACNATIYFVKHENGSTCPYTAEGVSHFLDCPKADRFSRAR